MISHLRAALVAIIGFNTNVFAIIFFPEVFAGSCLFVDRLTLPLLTCKFIVKFENRGETLIHFSPKDTHGSTPQGLAPLRLLICLNSAGPLA